MFRTNKSEVLLISWFLFLLSSGILGGSDSNVMDDDQIMLDPNSIIGMFIRRCLLTFNQMSFEVLICTTMSPIEHVDGCTLSLAMSLCVGYGWVGS